MVLPCWMKVTPLPFKRSVHLLEGGRDFSFHFSGANAKTLDTTQFSYKQVQVTDPKLSEVH